MEELMNILTETCPGIDFEGSTTAFWIPWISSCWWAS